MTNSERNAGQQIIEVLNVVAGQAEEVLDHLNDNPLIEVRFQEVVARYGKLLTPWLRDIVREATEADTIARVDRLQVITAQYNNLCETETPEDAMKLLELAFK
jgi:hypothetical protein